MDSCRQEPLDQSDAEYLSDALQDFYVEELTLEEGDVKNCLYQFVRAVCFTPAH